MTNNQKNIINTHLENTLRGQLQDEGKQKWETDSRIKYAHFANELFLNDCTEQQIEDMVEKIEHEVAHTNTAYLEELIK